MSPGKSSVDPSEKMILRHFVKRRRRREPTRCAARHIVLELAFNTIAHRVPADDAALIAALDVAVAGKRRLLVRRDGVDVRWSGAWLDGPGGASAQLRARAFPAIGAVRSGPWLCMASSNTDCNDSDILSPLPVDADAPREA